MPGRIISDVSIGAIQGHLSDDFRAAFHRVFKAKVDFYTTSDPSEYEVVVREVKLKDHPPQMRAFVLGFSACAEAEQNRKFTRAQNPVMPLPARSKHVREAV